MAKNSIYLNCKALLKETAKTEKRHNKNDKPRVRQVLNDLLDELIRQIDYHALKETITTKKANMYKFWLTNYTISLHP